MKKNSCTWPGRVKIDLVVFWITLLAGMPALAQLPCSEVTQVNLVTDTTIDRLLIKTIHRFEKEWWVGDKGIVHLYEYFDKEGNYCWFLKPFIDDTYRDNPPNRFMDFRGDIVLIYSADSNRNLIPPGGNKKARNDCLNQIVGDRVYIRPSQRERWSSYSQTIHGRTTRGKGRRIVAGHAGDTVIVFKSNGLEEHFLL